MVSELNDPPDTLHDMSCGKRKKRFVTWPQGGATQRFPHRERNFEYSGLFSGSLLEMNRRLREALALPYSGLCGLLSSHIERTCVYEPPCLNHNQALQYLPRYLRQLHHAVLR